MKTSNYILIAFFTFLFGGIFVLFLTAKTDPRNNQHQEFLTLEKPLGDFSAIVAETGVEVHLKSGIVSTMSLKYVKGDTCTFPKFDIRNDTLFMLPFSEKGKFQQINIYSKRIKTILGKDQSKIWLDQFLSDTLLIKLNKAELKYYPDRNNTKKFSLILIANQSTIRIGVAVFDKLNIQLNQSDMTAQGSSIDLFSGKLQEKSNLSIGTIKKINLETDSTSTYRLNK